MDVADGWALPRSWVVGMTPGQKPTDVPGMGVRLLVRKVELGLLKSALPEDRIAASRALEELRKAALRAEALQILINAGARWVK